MDAASVAIDAAKGASAAADVAANAGAAGADAEAAASASKLGGASVADANVSPATPAATPVSPPVTADTGTGVTAVPNTPPSVGSVASVEQAASNQAAVLIGNNSSNPAVAVAGDPALGIQTPAFTNIIARAFNFPGVQLSADGSTFVITDQDAFMQGVVNAYQGAGQNLNPATQQLIKNYISSQSSFPVQAGVPGLHAEVQALNSIYNSVPNPGSVNLSNVNIATYKVGSTTSAGKQGGPFTACTNCSNIIPSQVNVTTGTRAPGG